MAIIHVVLDKGRKRERERESDRQEEKYSVLIHVLQKSQFDNHISAG